MAKRGTLDYSVHHYYAIHFNQQFWKLLSKTRLSKEEQFEMIDIAHASNQHWRYVGSELNQQRGAYVIAKTYLKVKNLDQALIYAERCLALTKKYKKQMKDFDLAYAQEVLWRVEAARKNKRAAELYKKEARRLGDLIKGVEDKKIFDQDFKAK